MDTLENSIVKRHLPWAAKDNVFMSTEIMLTMQKLLCTRVWKLTKILDKNILTDLADHPFHIHSDLWNFSVPLFKDTIVALRPR